MEDDFMKKLLVLVLVLGMASLANATTVTLSISGPTSLGLGETGTYTISKSGMDALGVDVDIIADYGTQPYDIDNGAYLPSNADPAVSGVGINGASGNYEIWVMDDIDGLDLGTDIGTFDWTAPSVAPGGDNIVTLSLINNSVINLSWEVVGIDNADVVATEGIEVTVPEPITLALLGLGGLFIRRR